MRALLDVNVLIALLDPDHSLHEQARGWFSRNAPNGWASCPITQNGCVRIMAHPGYPNAVPVRSVMERLREATQSPYHELWADDLSLLGPSRCRSCRTTAPLNTRGFCSESPMNFPLDTFQSGLYLIIASIVNLRRDGA